MNSNHAAAADDIASMLPQVLAHLSELRNNVDAAEQVCNAVRHRALQLSPVLPKKAHLLARFSRLAIVATKRNVANVAIPACAALASCLARTEEPQKAALYLLGICEAIGDVTKARSRGVKTAILFLNRFESECVQEGSTTQTKLDVLPLRSTLRNLVALLRRMVNMPRDYGVLERADKAEMKYARMLWENVGDAAKQCVVCTVAHPALLAGCSGAALALDAVETLRELVLCVPLTPSAFAEVQTRVGVALQWHVQNANGQMTPGRADVVVKLVDVLRLCAGSNGICPKVWATAGVPSIVRGDEKVRNTMVEIAKSGRVADVAQGIGAVDVPRVVPHTTTRDMDSASLFNLSKSNCPAVDLNDPPDSGTCSTSEKLVLRAVWNELMLVPECTLTKHMQQLDRICFLALTRAGLWTCKCTWAPWMKIGNRLLEKILNAVKKGAVKDVIFATAANAMRLLAFLVGEAPMLEDGQFCGVQVQSDVVEMWRNVMVGLIEELGSIIKGPSNVLEMTDMNAVPLFLDVCASIAVSDDKQFRLVVPPVLKKSVCELCLMILRRIEMSDEVENRAVLREWIKCCRTLILVCDDDTRGQIVGDVDRITGFVSQFQQSDTLLACAAVEALGYCVYIAAGSSGDHANLVDLASLDEDDKVWGSVFHVVDSILKSNRNAQLVGAAAKCLEPLSVHCPRRSVAKCADIIVKCVWHTESATARRNAMKVVELLVTHAYIPPIGLRVSSDLWGELESKLEQNSVVPEEPSIGDCDLRILSLIARLNVEEPTMKKTAAVALDCLISGAVKELVNMENSLSGLKQQSSSAFEMTEQLPNFDNMQCWEELLFVTASVFNEKCTVYDDIEELTPWLISPLGGSTSQTQLSVNRSLNKRALVSDLASLLGSRMKDWLPLSFERMLRNERYAAVIASITMEEELNLWKKAARYALGPVLREGKVWMIDELALKLSIPKRAIVDKVSADVIASNALLSGNGIDVREDGPNSYIANILATPIVNILMLRANKIVQRLVLELGGVNNDMAVRALESLASNLRGTSKNAHAVGAGELISAHFLLIMDTVDRKLLDLETGVEEKIRYLGVLQGVLKVAKTNLRMYVHKVFSTLKVCLDSEDSMKAKTVEVWATLLQSLGVENIAPHLGSMLATFLPHMSKYSASVVPVLCELFMNDQQNLEPFLQEIRLLFRTVNHHSLHEISALIESRTEDVIMIDVENEESSEGQVSFSKFSSRCLEFLDVAIRHQSPEIRSIALGQLLETLKANRHHKKKAFELLVNEEYLGGSSPMLAMLVTNLSLLVAESKDESDLWALKCLGELGAIDPARISPHEQKCRRKRGSSHRDIHVKFCDVDMVAKHLLEQHLAPALWRNGPGDAVGHRLNRVGLAIQELLKAVSCDRKTAEKAKRAKLEPPASRRNTRDNSQSRPRKETGPIAFWNSLSEAAQTAAHPYLKEPFDVKMYESVMGTGKKFDFHAACVPIWSKMEADNRNVDLVEWRRQFLVQAIDFIGGEPGFGKLLSAVRPSLRYEINVAEAIFPYVILTAIDCEANEFEPPRLFRNFVIGELKNALNSRGAAVQSVFSLIDTLRGWRDARTQKLAKLKNYEMRKKIRSVLSKGGKPNVMETGLSLWDKEKKDDPLASIVDVNGYEDAQLSLLVQSRAALSARSYARVVFLAEQHVRNIRKQNGNNLWPAFIPRLLGKAEIRCSSQSSGIDDEDSALDILQSAFAELEDADSVKGLAAFRTSSTPSQSIVDAETSGNYDEALLSYERAMEEDNKSVDLHCGFLRCLCTLGYWETMLVHATGLSGQGMTLQRGEESLQKFARSLGMEAAWRLGRWDQLEELCKAESVESCFGVDSSKFSTGIPKVGAAIGRSLLRVHQKQWDTAKEVIRVTETALLPHVAHAALEGYSRAYPLLVHLHTLADVEDLAENMKKQQSTNGTKTNAIELARSDCRSSYTASSLKVREPLLSVRRACLEMMDRRSLASKVSIELAQLARESGNFRAATAAASHASSNTNRDDPAWFACATELAHIRSAKGDSAGALEQLKKVISGMTTALDKVQSGSSPGPQSKKRDAIDEIKTRLCAAHVLAGQWTEESRSESSEVVLKHFTDATEYCPVSDQAFYALGRHYDFLWQAALATEGRGIDGRYSRVTQSQGSRIDRRLSKIKRNHYEYVPLIINSFSKALQNGHTRLFEALPRLLTVWFDFYSKQAKAKNKDAAIHVAESFAKKEIRDAFRKIPVYMWMSVVPQLMSRMLHESPVIQEEVSNLLARLLIKYPNQGVWLIASSSELRSSKRREAVSNVINKAVASLKRVRKSQSASSASDSQKLRKNMAANFNKFIRGGLTVVKDLIRICEREMKCKKGGGKLNCAEEFMTVTRNMQRTNLMVPTLRGLTVTLPGSSNDDGNSHRPFAEEPACLADIEDEVLVMNSLMAPRRIGFIGSDGRLYRFLAKRENNGDMRKDSRLMEFVTVVNRLLAKDSQSHARDLKLSTYAVIPLTEQTGIIEWVNDLVPLRQIVREELQYLGRGPDGSEIAARHNSYRDKKRFLEEWAFVHFPPMLDRFFVHTWGSDARSWLEARSLWTRSVAAWSITGYIVGLGDRHAENILIEATSGRVVHVDFAMLFDKGEQLKVPEVVPFRLTPNMVGAFGVAGTEGLFRCSCETAMRVMRSNEDALMGTIEAFVHDPLIEVSGNRVTEALKTNAAVRNKLKGIVDRSGIALSVQGQVQKLITDASSIERLSEMYLWWAPWT